MKTSSSPWIVISSPNMSVSTSNQRNISRALACRLAMERIAVPMAAMVHVERAQTAIAVQRTGFAWTRKAVTLNATIKSVAPMVAADSVVSVPVASRAPRQGYVKSLSIVANARPTPAAARRQRARSIAAEMTVETSPPRVFVLATSPLIATTTESSAPSTARSTGASITAAV